MLLEIFSTVFRKESKEEWHYPDAFVSFPCGVASKQGRLEQKDSLKVRFGMPAMEKCWLSG